MGGRGMCLTDSASGSCSWEGWPHVLGACLKGHGVPAPGQSGRWLPPRSRVAGRKGLPPDTVSSASGLLPHLCPGGCTFVGLPGAGQGGNSILHQPSARLQPLKAQGPPSRRILPSPPILTPQPPGGTPSSPPPQGTYNHIKAGIEAHDLSCRSWRGRGEGERKTGKRFRSEPGCCARA